MAFLLAADKLIVVITPDPAAISDAYAVIKVAKFLKPTIPLLLTPNMVSSKEEAEILFKKMNLMTQKFLESRLVLGGIVMKDDLVARSVKKRRPFTLDYPNSAPVNAIKTLNRRVIQAPIVESAKEGNVFERVRLNKKMDIEWNP
jgi:flagellar biosynthesis protein FlhG